MSQKLSRSSLAALAVVGLVVQGCETSPDATEVERSALVGGTTSALLPNIGSGTLSIGDTGCTGTLIAGQWILTAGHCTDFRNSINNPSDYMTFFGTRTSAIFNLGPQIFPQTTDDNKLGSFAASRLNATPGGDTDVALLMLPHPIPDPTTRTVTSVVALAMSLPAVSSTVTSWGYGSTSLPASPYGGPKNDLAWSYSAPMGGVHLNENIVVPGDSGGPSFMTGVPVGQSSAASGEMGLWAVNSGYFGGGSAFGDVVYYRSQLCNLMYNKPHRFCQTGAPLGGEPSGCGPYVPGTTTNVATFVLNETSNGGGTPFQHCGTTAWDSTCVAEAQRWADPRDFAACRSPKGDTLLDGRSAITLVSNTHVGYGSVFQAGSNGNGTFVGIPVPYSDPSFDTWASQPGAKSVAGDFNGDGLTDIALTGGVGWGTLPVALNAQQVGNYQVNNAGISNGGSTVSFGSCTGAGFATWATCAGATPVAGDFDGDGKTDIALIGSPAFVGSSGQPLYNQAGALVGYQGSIPLAFSNGDGSFRVTNTSSGAPAGGTFGGAGYFELFAANSTAGQGWKPVVGDFDGDGRSDIALVGGAAQGQYLTYIPMALSNGDGTFRFVQATASGSINFYSNAGSSTPVAGDFNGDGFADIALTAGPGWTTIPIALSNGDGATFAVTNSSAGGVSVANFASYATQPGVRPVAGDFNGDGLADIALTGGVGWGTIPVAFMSVPSTGQFSATNAGTDNRYMNFPYTASFGGTPLGGSF